MSPLLLLLQLLDELQELTNQSQDLDVALIDKKIDQVGSAAGAERTEHEASGNSSSNRQPTNAARLACRALRVML